MAKVQKVYKIRESYSPLFGGRDREKIIEGTLQELIEMYSYTLEVGACYQNEKGRKKINRNPKTIKSLLTNLYNAKNNSAKNGYSGYDYELIEETGL